MDDFPDRKSRARLFLRRAVRGMTYRLIPIQGKLNSALKESRRGSVKDDFIRTTTRRCLHRGKTETKLRWRHTPCIKHLLAAVQKPRNGVRETFAIHGTVLAHMHVQLQVQSRDVSVHCSPFCERGPRILQTFERSPNLSRVGPTRGARNQAESICKTHAESDWLAGAAETRVTSCGGPSPDTTPGLAFYFVACRYRAINSGFAHTLYADIPGGRRRIMGRDIENCAKWRLIAFAQSSFSPLSMTLVFCVLFTRIEDEERGEERRERDHELAALDYPRSVFPSPINETLREIGFLRESFCGTKNRRMLKRNRDSSMDTTTHVKCKCVILHDRRGTSTLEPVIEEGHLSF
ncbi:hypothetical protein DBV15_08772 [Temnothorax longispinosus]|uniref:Uncharacterized protein n=1 Tax=Temnothorax longispinosus TaxID=300112 RepID=A0A4S2KVQ9_9HYME|nr:hypothetical protein DBV15_08772 [Temnothorax longispinosus]